MVTDSYCSRPAQMAGPPYKDVGEILSLACQHVMRLGRLLSRLICAAFKKEKKKKYSMYCGGTERLSFPAFQHRGQRHLHTWEPWTAPGHSATTDDAEAAPNCCFPTRARAHTPLKTPNNICAWNGFYMMDGWMDGWTSKRLNAISTAKKCWCYDQGCAVLMKRSWQT